MTAKADLMFSTPGERDAVVALVSSGVSVRAAAARFGASRQTLYRAFKAIPEFKAAVDAARLEAQAAAGASKRAAELEAEQKAEARRLAIRERTRTTAVDAVLETVGAPIDLEGVEIMDANELLRILSYCARHPEAPAHELSLKLLARYQLEAPLLEQLAKIKALAKVRPSGKQRVIVLHVPTDGGGG